MPEEISKQLPQTPDNQWKDLQFRFDGRWVPDVDASLIGPNNYSTLQNMRYKDSGLEGVNGYTLINTTAPDANYVKIRNGFQLRSDRTQKTYTLARIVDDSENGRVYVNRTDIGDQGDFDTSARFAVNGNAYYDDSAANLTGRFSTAPQGNICYCNGREAMIFAGDEQSPAALFSVSSNDVTPTYPVDYTDEISSDIESDYMTISSAGKKYAVLMTTRPIQGIKFYMETVNTQTDTTLHVYEWNGTAWNELSITDNTELSGAALGQDGWVTFDHTKSTVKLKHYEELYLYAYLIYLEETTGTDATANIYSLTVDCAMQNVENVWDGVYRQPTQFQVKYDTGDAYTDFTAPVNVASEESAPVGARLKDATDALTNNGEIIIMFSERMAGIRMQMIGGLVNTAGGTLSVSYWNGSAYAAVTSQLDGSSVLSQTGLISWIPNSAEKPLTLFNTFGYAYKITVSTTVTATSTCYIDLCTGVPASVLMKPYDFSLNYGTRLMLASPSRNNEGNRLDYSSANAPDVFNGEDSSDNGQQSLYFGGKEKLTAGAALYNRFGSNLISVLLVLKDAETYVLVGDTPAEFTIYEVSKTIGCPAPLTLATGEVNTSESPTEGVTRNIAMWMSASGPVTFDGASLSAVRGMENYFDPNNNEYIEWTYVNRCRGYIDNVYKEYNLLIPSSSSQEKLNKWLVYDLLRRKWYEKNTGTAEMPQSAFEVIDEVGQRRTYAGTNTGFMLYLENGTSWNTVGITQKVKTGDFFPSSNIWDLTTIRKSKLLTSKFEDVESSNFLDIYYYKNTEETIGSGVAFISSDDGFTGSAVDFTDTLDVVFAATAAVSINVNQDIGSRRVLSIVTDENRTAWAHAYEFQITTTNVPRGFRPIAWGVRYRVERKDDTATQ